MTDLRQRLGRVGEVSGAAWAALFPCHGGILTVENATYWQSVPSAGEELLHAGMEAVPIPGKAGVEQAIRIGALFAERRRGPRPLRVRCHVGGAANWLLVLEKGGAPAPMDLISLALDDLSATVSARTPFYGLEAAQAFIALDGRMCLLADTGGWPVALAPLMRQVLGGGKGNRPFLPEPRVRPFLQQVRNLATAWVAGGERPDPEPAEGFNLAATVSLEPLHGGNWFLAVVEGDAALEAGLRSIANAPLTEREVTCGLRLAEGKSYKSIAAELNLSPDTVKLHLRALYQKMEVDGREGLVARLAGLSPPSLIARQIASLR